MVNILLLREKEVSKLFAVMNYESYGDIKIENDFQEYSFISKGRNGPIEKVVAFDPMETPGVFNLSLNDVRDDGSLDDDSVSDNGDTRKILATIFKIAIIYTDRYPERSIHFEGKEARIRLYRMAIGLTLEELSKEFKINVLDEKQETVPFQKDMPVTAFMVKRKMT